MKYYRCSPNSSRLYNCYKLSRSQTLGTDPLRRMCTAFGSGGQCRSPSDKERKACC